MLSDRFTPHRLFSGAHTQTILSHLLPADGLNAEFQKWSLPLKDEDSLTGRLFVGRKPVVVALFHGLGGSIDSKYIRLCSEELKSQGYSVLLVNHRSAGEGLSLAKGIYHSGAIFDVEAVIESLRDGFPDHKIVAVGFSLSANLLLNVAGQIQGRGLPDAVVSVNPPIDLHTTARYLLRPSNLVYDQKFVRDLKLLMREKYLLGHVKEMPKFPRFCRLVDFDEIVTARMVGFSSRDEYYTQCSSARVAHRIQIPTWILTSEDDPFIPAEPFHSTKFGSSVHLQLEKRGGHVGYLTGSLRVKRWLPTFVANAVEKLIS